MSHLPYKTTFRFSRRPKPSSAWLRVADAIDESLEFLGRWFCVSLQFRGYQLNPLRLDFSPWRTRTGDPGLRRGIGLAFLLHVAFVGILGLFMILRGCWWEEYLLPQGGGANVMAGKRVVIKRVKKPQKKIKQVVNPFSPIRFEVPDIEEMMKEKITDFFTEETRERYAVGFEGTGTSTGKLGFGKGDGSGYSIGHGDGLVRFIRIKYDGSGWDNNLGKGADYNILLELRIRTGQKVADQTEYRSVEELGRFVKFRSPPLVYITGDKSVSFSKSQIAILRKYVVDMHGMILADNAGSARWGADFRGLMRNILPEVPPVRMTLDDVIFKEPYPLGRMPFVSPHDGTDMMGWKIDGRWVALYHPGDLADAWKDGHAGVSRDVWESAYELGVNIIHYSNRTYSQWVEEAKGKGAKQ